jgi:hypothetical protein
MPGSCPMTSHSKLNDEDKTMKFAFWNAGGYTKEEAPEFKNICLKSNILIIMET